MNAPRLLLLSSSRVAGHAGYLDAYADWITAFLGGRGRGAFVPWAGVSIAADEYTRQVAERFAALGLELRGVDAGHDPLAVLAACDWTVVGGGNTFRLLGALQRSGALGLIRARVLAGMPYIGWSAGANVACPTLCTTNDMPIEMPVGFGALGLVPFQINPHYTDARPPDHQGETRDQRIAEFLALDRGLSVVGLREGSALRVEGRQVTLLGPHPLRLFRAGEAPVELEPGDLSRMLSAD